MTLRKSKLKEIVNYIVRKTLNELTSDPTISLASTGNTTPSVSGNDIPIGISSGEQDKLDRMQKRRAQQQLKMDKRELHQAEAKLKSLENDYKITRRYTVPNKRKELANKTRAIAKL